MSKDDKVYVIKGDHRKIKWYAEVMVSVEGEMMPPFRRLGLNRYISPSGRIFTKSQVQRYYARGGRF